MVVVPNAVLVAIVRRCLPERMAFFCRHFRALRKGVRVVLLVLLLAPFCTLFL